MDLKFKDIVIIVLVMLISFPVVFFAILLLTGNLRIEFGPEKPGTENDVVVEVRPSAVSDSLAIENSKTWQALQQERAEIDAERKSLAEERQKLELFQSDLETKKNEIRASQERIESLVSQSDTFERKKNAQLARVYGSMRPAEAASIIATLQDEFAAGILDGIGDDRQKAKIIAALPKEKAVRLTKLMGGGSRRK
jgi:flagellar motility protein MotE (MotC chaperone)